MTATPTPDERPAQPNPQGQPRVIYRPPGSTAAARHHLTHEEFCAAYQLAVSTGSDPQLDGLVLRHLLLHAARPAELLALQCSDIDVTRSTFMVRRSRLVEGWVSQESTFEHVAALATHVLERGPRNAAPPDAPEELRRAGVPAVAGVDPVFYGRPVDSYDADGYFVARQVRPLTRSRLMSLAARIRQRGGPHVTLSSVRALSFRLHWAAGYDGRGALRHAAPVDLSSYIRRTSQELQADLDQRGPDAGDS
jgi:integrase